MLRSYQDKDDWNAIDPNLVLDGDRAWPINGSVEAPFIVRHGDYWYLFMSSDRCCRGANEPAQNS